MGSRRINIKNSMVSTTNMT